MPRKAIRIQELRRVSGSPVVMVAVFITSFCQQKPRGKSDWLQTEGLKESWWVRGRTHWHSRGVKCQHAAEGRLRKGTGQMSMWLIHDKTSFLAIWLWFKVWCTAILLIYLVRMIQQILTSDVGNLFCLEVYSHFAQLLSVLKINKNVFCFFSTCLTLMSQWSGFINMLRALINLHTFESPWNSIKNTDL